jgi:exodeoxyribonuclease-5
MVDRELWNDLIRVAVRQRFYVLLMGDLFQLPPVMKEEGVQFSTLAYDTPFKTNLTQVIRQALDSPIIRASMLLRDGRPEREALMLLKPVGASKLIESSMEIRDRGGVTICFTNKRRHVINNAVRAARGYEPGTVVAGEPLLVVQNNYDLNVYNGEIVDFKGWDAAPCAPWAVTDRYSNSSVHMSLGVSSFGDGGQPFTVCPEEVSGATDSAGVSGWTIRKTARDWWKNKHPDQEISHLDAHYGQSLTCHKSQGSEWPEVLIVMEDALNRLIPIERKRWLYTATTRAKHTVCYIHVKESR